LPVFHCENGPQTTENEPTGGSQTGKGNRDEKPCSLLALLALIAFAPAVVAVPMSGPRLLVVFLLGAFDASSILAPVSSDFHYSVRPNLAIAKSAALPKPTTPLSRISRRRTRSSWVNRKADRATINQAS
jgi:hypothetical protein